MNSQELNQAWEEVCSQIKSYEGVDVSQVNAFFSRIHPQAMSEGFIALTAETDFIKIWVEKHYLDHISRALEDTYHVPFAIIIEVDLNEDQAPAMPSPEKAPVEQKAEIPTQHQEIQPAHEAASKENDQECLPTSTYTFENFVIGDSNRMAYSMAVSVAETPGKAHLNPLFIYGKSGLGKTHLLRSIQHYVNQNFPNLVVVYADSAEFLNDYVEARISHDTEKVSYRNFKRRYEEADILMIDDVQWLQNKSSTLEVVFQLFNTLSNQGKQIVLSADRAPKNIDIDERYKSRFNQGGTVSIQPPEIETKIGIIKNFINEFRRNENRPDFSIPEEIQSYIAEISSSNVRELRSAVTSVISKIIYSGKMIGLEDVKVLLQNHFSGGASRRLSVDDIQVQVEEYYKVSHADLVSNKRSREIVYARQVAVYLCRTMLDIPFNEIGKRFNRDHTTIMYCVNNIEKKLQESRDLQEELESLKQLIREA